MTTPRPLETVERAVRVLNVLAEAPRDLGNNEIARLSDVNLSTVSRMLQTLVAAGFVLRVAETGRYRLGARMVELGNAALAGVDLRNTARGHLLDLATATGETATLSVPTAQGLVTVDFERSRAAVSTMAEVGRQAVPHATATGKVYLAHAGELPEGELTCYTPRTITTHAELTAEVERGKRRGWAEAVGERDTELNAIATPIVDGRGELRGVLGLQGPANRFGARARKAAAKALTRHARDIAAGHPRARD